MFSVDVLDLAYMWFESHPIESLSFDSLRALFGLSTEGAHNAIVDVKQCAEIFKHFIMLHRKVGQYVKWNS
jgi:DNA polymerase III epsilon subunit-like protein